MRQPPDGRLLVCRKILNSEIGIGDIQNRQKKESLPQWGIDRFA